MSQVTVDLDEDRKYRVVETQANIEFDIRGVLSRADYPRRLFAGLDDLPLSTLESSLQNTQILTLGLRLTNVCNYDCIYCGTAAKRGRDTASVLTTAEYKDLIDQAAELGARCVIFGANGEPTMTRDVLELLRHVGARGMTPLIFSNMSIIGNDAMCRRLHGVDGIEFLRRLDEAGTSLIISVESLRREPYNHIMGVETYDYFLEAIERVRKHSTLTRAREYQGRPLCRVAVSAVVMPINYEERHDLVEFAHSLNGLVILKPPSLHGSAATHRDQMFSVEDAIRIRPELEALSDKQATLQILTLACGSWTLGFSVDNEGNFMSCMTEEVNPFHQAANARNTRLSELVNRRNELVKLRSTVCPVKDKFYVRTPTVEAAAAYVEGTLAESSPTGRISLPIIGR